MPGCSDRYDRNNMPPEHEPKGVAVDKSPRFAGRADSLAYACSGPFPEPACAMPHSCALLLPLRDFCL